ncbi:baseplate J/gp47 family protein [Variovorax sp. PAMC26660]|uniref:baseplate assembly protein n=1 Tax=Variovorax sp. PAMC26660 TaxID=2762322 RepID=UPI00164E317B|nr:baseplate J/gp47 family protein [Variovorax sp. PAMC26660]QNK67759.1 baseplate J/gp47 family protein [Variovorax sp. PAMC26660]
MSMDMSLLPAPTVIEVLDFEVILARRLASFQTRYPDYSLVLESDPAYKLLEEMAYQELLMRQRINDAAKACMLAYAKGTDLDNLGANYQVPRLVVTPANPNAVPPVAAAYEDDERFRERIQLAPEGITTAGPEESYRYHALTASAQVDVRRRHRCRECHGPEALDAARSAHGSCGPNARHLDMPAWR